MRLLVDEGIDRQIVDRLRDAGHDVTYVAEIEPGVTDDAVLDLANDESRIVPGFALLLLLIGLISGAARGEENSVWCV